MPGLAPSSSVNASIGARDSTVRSRALPEFRQCSAVETFDGSTVDARRRRRIPRSPTPHKLREALRFHTWPPPCVAVDAMKHAMALTDGPCGERTTDAPMLDRRASLAIGGAVFLLLTLTIFWHQFRAIPEAPTRCEWDRLRWPYLVLIVACVPGETLLAAIRTSLVC